MLTALPMVIFGHRLHLLLVLQGFPSQLHACLEKSLLVILLSLMNRLRRCCRGAWLGLMARTDRVFTGELASNAHRLLTHDVCVGSICDMLLLLMVWWELILPLLKVLKLVSGLSKGFGGRNLLERVVLVVCARWGREIYLCLNASANLYHCRLLLRTVEGDWFELGGRFYSILSFTAIVGDRCDGDLAGFAFLLLHTLMRLEQGWVILISSTEHPLGPVCDTAWGRWVIIHGGLGSGLVRYHLHFVRVLFIILFILMLLKRTAMCR